MLKPVALFDFDNTIAQGDTIVRLLEYDLKKHPWHIYRFMISGFYYILYLLHLSSFEKAKSQLLFPLDYMNDQQLQTFYHDQVEPYYYPEVLQQLKKHKANGYIVIVCTASSEAYMQYHTLPIDAMIGTRTERINHRPSSHIFGKNCKGKNKVPRILDYLHEHDIEIDYDNSYAYSDSRSDIPMLELVKHKKRVLLKSGKIVDFIE